MLWLVLAWRDSTSFDFDPIPIQKGVSIWKRPENGLIIHRFFRLITHALPRVNTLCMDSSSRLREDANELGRSGGVARSTYISRGLHPTLTQGGET